MKANPKEQTKGKTHEVKGEVREGAGKISRDVSMERQGREEKISGKIQKGAGKLEKKRER